MGFKSVLISAILFSIFAVLCHLYMQKDTKLKVFGYCEKDFLNVQEVYKALFDEGQEDGSAFAVYYQGKPVCDLWGGYQDDISQYPWQRDTVGLFWSVTKGISAICLMMLADRGLIDYHQPVAKYWPDFAQNGKENITIQLLVSHQGGLAAVDNEEITYSMIKDEPQRLGEILARQAPAWIPGTTHGYHTLVFDLFIDQLIMRMDPKHRRLHQFFREEVAEPFDIDFHIGLPKELHYRAARCQKIPVWWANYHLLGEDFSSPFNPLFTPSPLYLKTISNPVVPQVDTTLVDSINWPESRETPWGSVCGYGTARAMAKFFGILSSGGSMDGKVLLSQKSLPMLTEKVVSGKDAVLNMHISWGNGLFQWPGPGGSHSFGHVGLGGQVGLGNMEHQLGIGYTTTRLSLGLYDTDHRYKRLQNAVFDSLKKIGEE